MLDFFPVAPVARSSFCCTEFFFELLNSPPPLKKYCSFPSFMKEINEKFDIFFVSVSLEVKNLPTITSSQLRMRSWHACVAQSTAANTSINSRIFPQIFQPRSFCEIKFYLWAKCTIIRCKIFVYGLCKHIESVTSLYLPFSLFVWDTFCMLHDIYNRFVLLKLF